eukprot:5577146-Pyramimonas_sp.AAC.1
MATTTTTLTTTTTTTNTTATTKTTQIATIIRIRNRRSIVLSRIISICNISHNIVRAMSSLSITIVY